MDLDIVPLGSEYNLYQDPPVMVLGLVPLGSVYHLYQDPLSWF